MAATVSARVIRTMMSECPAAGAARACTQGVPVSWTYRFKTVLVSRKKAGTVSDARGGRYGDGFALDGDGPAVLVGGQVGDRRLDLADETGVEQALLHLLAAELVAADGRCGRRLLGLPMSLQGVEDHVILGAEAARQDLVVHIT